MKNVFLVLLLLATSTIANAQNVVNGRVIDKYGNPISGAKVQGKGTSKWVESSIDGSYSLETPLRVSKIKVTAMGKAPKIKHVEKKKLTTVKMAPLKYWNNKTGFRYFVNAQCGLISSGSKDVPFGLMVGMVKRTGIYAKGLFSGLPSTIADEADKYSYSSNEYSYRTGKVKTGFLSTTVGFVWRMGCPVYGYFGGGYAYRKVAYEAFMDGQYYKSIYEAEHSLKDYSRKGLTVELGVMANFKYFTFNIGSSLIKDVEGEGSPINTVHFGVGYMF